VKDLVEKIQLAWKMFAAMALVVMRNRILRRKLMFGVSLTAMFLVFIGMTLLDEFLTDHVLLLLIYWLIAGATVVLMLLLALYDMMMVRSEQAGNEVAELARIVKEVERLKAEQEKESE
jgi:hypothetical protein